MEYRRLGKSGLRVSALSFGSWVTFGTSIDEIKAAELIEYAFSQGVNFFDNAEVYSQGQSEVIMGKAIKRLSLKRDSYCVSSKVFWGGDQPTQSGLSRKHVVEACESALKRLQVEYLDLYFCHRPDIDTPIEETVRAMHELVMRGKIFYWGTSEWSSRQISEAYLIAKANHLTPPTMEQPEYNLLKRERFESEYRSLFEDYGLGTTVWSPLASGLLTGKYNKGIPAGSRLTIKDYEWLKRKVESEEGKRNIEKIEKFAALAKKTGTTSTKLALAWCLNNPNVSTVILGASKMEQLKENLTAIDVVKSIDEKLMSEIDSIFDNKPEPPKDFKA